MSQQIPEAEENRKLVANNFVVMTQGIPAAKKIDYYTKIRS